MRQHTASKPGQLRVGVLTGFVSCADIVKLHVTMVERFTVAGHAGIVRGRRPNMRVALGINRRAWFG
jgi:uncharacterized membrane protein